MVITYLPVSIKKTFPKVGTGDAKQRNRARRTKPHTHVYGEILFLTSIGPVLQTVSPNSYTSSVIVRVYVCACLSDTYVKTYLMDGVKRLQNKRTKVVRGSSEPFYISKLKYPASNVHGRYLQVRAST